MEGCEDERSGESKSSNPNNPSSIFDICPQTPRFALSSPECSFSRPQPHSRIGINHSNGSSLPRTKGPTTSTTYPRPLLSRLWAFGEELESDPIVNHHQKCLASERCAGATRFFPSRIFCDLGPDAWCFWEILIELDTDVIGA